MKRLLLISVLFSSLCSAATFSAWNGITIGRSSAGQLAQLNGKRFGNTSSGMLAYVNSFRTISGSSGSAGPGLITFNNWSSVPAQLTATWTNGSPSASTFNLYYADNAVASIIPANKDCTYLLLTAYDSGLDPYPGTPNATAGKYTGLTGTSYSVNGPLTAGTTYCARVSGVTSGIEGLGSTTKTAAAAANYDTGGSGWSLSFPITASKTGSGEVFTVSKKRVYLVPGTITYTWSLDGDGEDAYSDTSILISSGDSDSNYAGVAINDSYTHSITGRRWVGFQCYADGTSGFATATISSISVPVQ